MSSSFGWLRYICPVVFTDIYPVVFADICPVVFADIYPVVFTGICPASEYHVINYDQ